MFQSPSLRGSGRFLIGTEARSGSPRFNPLHCGAVVASQEAERARKEAAEFQSPSLRGSGRFGAPGPPCGASGAFQSPSLRGSGRFPSSGTSERGAAAHVSIPFIAGQWSLHPAVGRGEGPPRVSIPFIAGQWSLPAWRRGKEDHDGVSIPFIAGQWSLRCPRRRRRARAALFQSPSLRGSGRFSPSALTSARSSARCFNPLHCGAVVASKTTPRHS